MFLNGTCEAVHTTFRFEPFFDPAHHRPRAVDQCLRWLPVDIDKVLREVRLTIVLDRDLQRSEDAAITVDERVHVRRGLDAGPPQRAASLGAGVTDRLDPR